ncbi:MAG: hypothetical protein RLZZ450_2402 [Pseudomonadota bacterium]
MWTRSVSNYVEQSLLDLESDGELLETACRDTLCRVQLRFESVHDAREFAEAASRPTNTRDTKLALDKDQRLTLEVFVSRPQ